MQINGDVAEQKGGRFAPPLSIPQVKEALLKAAYDPRIRGIHLKVGSVSVGWARLQVRLAETACDFCVSYLSSHACAVTSLPAPCLSWSLFMLLQPPQATSGEQVPLAAMLLVIAALVSRMSFLRCVGCILCLSCSLPLSLCLWLRGPSCDILAW